MNGPYALNPYLEQALSEHRELHHLVEELRRRLAPTGSQATRAEYDRGLEDLAQLRDRLAAHFETEEAGGVFDEAISRCPRIAPQAASLQRQHAQFVKLIDGLLRPADGWREHWDDVRTRFERFSEKLEAHEEAENGILGRAFNVAING